MTLAKALAQVPTEILNLNTDNSTLDDSNA